MARNAIAGIRESATVGNRKQHRISPRTRNTLFALALIGFIFSTLMAIPIGTKPVHNLRITLANRSVFSDFVSLNRYGVVPKNILASTVTPKPAQLIGKENLDNGNGPFDRSVTYLVHRSTKVTVNFERSALLHFGWTILTVTKKTGVTTFYARKAGTDGNYWEVGATVSPSHMTTLSSQTTPTESTLSIRLLVISYS